MTRKITLAFMPLVNSPNPVFIRTIDIKGSQRIEDVLAKIPMSRGLVPCTINSGIPFVDYDQDTLTAGKLAANSYSVLLERLPRGSFEKYLEQERKFVKHLAAYSP